MPRLLTTASFLEPNLTPTRETADFALRFFDSLSAANGGSVLQDGSARRIFHAAALLLNIAQGSGQKSHHKAAQKILRTLAPPPGWTKDDMNHLALGARYHHGA